MHGIHNLHMHNEKHLKRAITFGTKSSKICGKIKCNCMPKLNNETMKLPSLCFIQHVDFVSVGDQGAEYRRIDYEMILQAVV